MFSLRGSEAQMCSFHKLFHNKDILQFSFAL